uniref:SCP domain-containing protein n=1 Tax=Calidris pygmaea TaxID=425635 RepID=A0A8C3JUF5_9CHAR
QGLLLRSPGQTPSASRQTEDSLLRPRGLPSSLPQRQGPAPASGTAAAPTSAVLTGIVTARDGPAAPRRPAGPPACSSSSSSPEHPGHDEEDAEHQHHRDHRLLHRRQHHGGRHRRPPANEPPAQRGREARARLPLPPSRPHSAPLCGGGLPRRFPEGERSGRGGCPSGEAPTVGGMRPWVAVVALWPVLRGAARQSPTFPSITDEAFIEECVRVHNDLRRKVQPPASNMRYMTWDEALARTARAWANKCIFEHNVYLKKKHQCHPNFTSIGENIWAGSHQIFKAGDAIKSWYSEVNFYTFADQKCTKTCGHYTQVRVIFVKMSCIVPNR